MREIKFRDWDPETKEMRYFHLDGYDREVHNAYGNIMQFTGLLDKNGKEIFEGDIISTPYFFNWTITGYEKRRIFFKDGVFGVKENEHDFIALKSLFKGIESSKTYISNYGEIYREFEPMFEVIGNIYQNPELVEIN